MRWTRHLCLSRTTEPARIYSEQKKSIRNATKTNEQWMGVDARWNDAWRRRTQRLAIDCRPTTGRDNARGRDNVLRRRRDADRTYRTRTTAVGYARSVTRVRRGALIRLRYSGARARVWVCARRRARRTSRARASRALSCTNPTGATGATINRPNRSDSAAFARDPDPSVYPIASLNLSTPSVFENVSNPLPGLWSCASDRRGIALAPCGVARRTKTVNTRE